jgi:hypothetical protein
MIGGEGTDSKRDIENIEKGREERGEERDEEEEKIIKQKQYPLSHSDHATGMGSKYVDM